MIPTMKPKEYDRLCALAERAKTVEHLKLVILCLLEIIRDTHEWEAPER